MSDMVDVGIVFWGLNVLVQVTLITTTVLLVAAGLRRHPAMRSGVLSVALILILLVPVLAVRGQVPGLVWLTINFDVDGTIPEPSEPLDPTSSIPEGTTAWPIPIDEQNGFVLETVPVETLTGTEPNPSPTLDVAAAREWTVPVASGEDIDLTAHETNTSIEQAEPVPMQTDWRWWIPLGLAVWGAGVLVGLVRLGFGLIKLQRMIRASRHCEDASTKSCLQEVCELVRVKHLPGLAQSTIVSSPVTVGWIKPWIVLPEGVTGLLSREELRPVLLHELAHVIRRDPLVLLLQHLAGSVYWFHPLVWLLNQKLARAREEVCDNHVLADTKAPAYSRTLLTLTELLQNERPLPGAVCLMNSQWRLENRVAGLLDPHRNVATGLSRVARTTVAGVALAMLALVFGVSITSAPAEAQAQPRPGEARQPEVDEPRQTKPVAVAADETPSGNEQPEPAILPVMPRPNAAEIEAAKQLFRRSRSDFAARTRALKILYPLVRPGMRYDDVPSLFGPYDRIPGRENHARIICYRIGEGQHIEIECDQKREFVVCKRAIGLGLDPPVKPTSLIPDNQRSYLADYKVDAKPESDRTVLRAGFIPHKPEVVWGEPLTLTMTVTNIGDADFEFMFGGDYRGSGRHDRIKILVTDSEGNELVDPKANALDFGGISSYELVTPGGASFSRAIALDDFRTIPGPGKYSVSCRYALDEPHTNKEGPKKPVIESSFRFTILERTPERVAAVLDELQATIADTEDRQLNDIMTSIARFGRDDAVPRLEHYAKFGTAPQRTAAVSALPIIDTEVALNVVLPQLVAREAVIRAAAVSALGRMSQSRSVDALFKAFFDEDAQVRAAVLVALGTSKSERAIPLLSKVLDDGPAELRPAAVTGLVRFGGEVATKTLLSHVETPDYAFRYLVVKAIVEDLRQPLNPDWLKPILMCRRHNHREWLGSLNMVRIWNGEQAAPVLLSCLDFDVPWSHRNFWILHNAKYAEGAPEFDYIYDPNTRGTPDEHDKNRETLKRLRKVAGPISKPTVWRSRSVPELKTDPPIDFSVTLSPLQGLSEQRFTVTCGFFTETKTGNSGSSSVRPSEAYRAMYKVADDVRAILKTPEAEEASGLTAEQVQKLRKLQPPPRDPDIEEGLGLLMMWWQESPEGPIRDRAGERIRNNVRAAVQEFHTDHVAYAAAARKIMGAVQRLDAQAQTAEPPQFGIQRIEPSLLRSRRWLELKARLDSSPVKYRWVEMGPTGNCNLSLESTPTSDLSHLEGMTIHYLDLSDTAVRDLSPLKGMSLQVLRIQGTQVQSLSPLKGMKLRDINISNSSIRDLGPLSDAELKNLSAYSTKVTDLAPLSGMPLEYVDLRRSPVSDLTPIANDKLWSLNIEQCPVTDLRPLQKSPLINLRLRGADLDLSQLQGLKLKFLSLEGSQFDDLSGIEGLPIEKLSLSNTAVRDLTPIRGMALTALTVAGSPVTDLTPAQGMKLTNLSVSEPGVDLAPVAGMPLERVAIWNVPDVKNIEVLRGITTLKAIQTEGKPTPPAEFWRRYDAGEFSR